MALQTKDFSLSAKSGSGRITYTYTIRVTENSIDPVQNCSQVTVEAVLQQTYSGTAFSGYRTGVSCTVNGETLFSDYCRRSISGKEEHVYYTWEGSMPHEADGTLTLRVSGKLWQPTPADYTPPTMVIPEGEMVLTPIPRASQVGAADGIVGGRSTVVITPADPAFTHTLTYRFGSELGYISQSGSVCDQPEMLTGTTVSFLIPDSFYAQIPDKAWDYCRLKCDTYSAETWIGSRETTFRVSTDPEQCGPIVNFSAVDAEPKTLALTKDANILIRYMSRLRVTLEAQGACGAQITRRTVNGQELTEDYLDIPQVQNYSVQAVVTDSRGYSAGFERTLEMIPYIKLSNNASVTRISPATGQAQLTFSGSCYRGSLGQVSNSLVLRYRFCPAGEEPGPWQTLEGQISDDHTYQLQTVLSGLDYTKTYTLQTQAVDALDEADAVLAVLPGIPVFHWNKERFCFRVPVECEESVSGAYIRTHTLTGADRITLTMEKEQTLFLFGGAGMLCGVLGGNGSWWGTGEVTASQEAEAVSVLLPTGCGGELLLISARPFSIE